MIIISLIRLLRHTPPPIADADTPPICFRWCLSLMLFAAAFFRLSPFLRRFLLRFHFRLMLMPLIAELLIRRFFAFYCRFDAALVYATSADFRHFSWLFRCWCHFRCFAASLYLMMIFFSLVFAFFRCHCFFSLRHATPRRHFADACFSSFPLFHVTPAPARHIRYATPLTVAMMLMPFAMLHAATPRRRAPR